MLWKIGTIAFGLTNVVLGGAVIVASVLYSDEKEKRKAVESAYGAGLGLASTVCEYQNSVIDRLLNEKSTKD